MLYVPILKWKAGEKNALQMLSENEKNKLTPIIEIIENEAIPDILKSAKSLNGIRKIFVDTSYVEEGESGYLENLISESLSEEIEFIPTISYEEFKVRSTNFIDICTEILVKIAIPSDFDGDTYDTMFNLLERWKEKHGIALNVLLDLGLVEDKVYANRQYSELKTVLKEHIRKSTIKNVIISVTSFPDDLSSLQAGGDIHFTRYDIKIFKSLLASQDIKDLKDRLSYSDYGVTKFTESEIDFSRLRYGILPKARYTTKDSYWILKGQKDKETKEWIISHRTIAQIILSSQYYYGEQFSFGDLEIKERALGHKLDSPETLVGPGGNTNWVTIAVSHHIAVVVDELSKFCDS